MLPRRATALPRIEFELPSRYEAVVRPRFGVELSATGCRVRVRDRLTRTPSTKLESNNHSTSCRERSRGCRESV